MRIHRFLGVADPDEDKSVVAQTLASSSVDFSDVFNRLLEQEDVQVSVECGVDKSVECGVDKSVECGKPNKSLYKENPKLYKKLYTRWQRSQIK